MDEPIVTRISKESTLLSDLFISDAGTGGARGATGPPNIWQISYPYLNRGGQIIPTYHYWPLQCFSPSGSTVNHLTLKSVKF